MKKLLKNLGKYLFQKYCKHEKRKTIFICLPDNYIKEKCKECKKEIYSDYYSS